MKHILALIVVLLAGLPLRALAHPHIFIETGLRVDVSDAGEVVAVEITWKYDELFSLLVLEDMQLDADYDGALTPEELDKLRGFDMNWTPGYEGDFYASLGGKALPLGPPEPVDTKVEDGQIITVHRRSLKAKADGLVLEAYDPLFYTAYEMTNAVEVGQGCAADIKRADTVAATDTLEELLFGMSQAEADEAFPQVGANFADKVVIRCNK
jgi:ABC-type uncharacterized transport system substrate-binding protein